MELGQLCGLLQACLSTELTHRQQAEAALKQAELLPGQIVVLLRVAAEDTVDTAVRQVAAIAFKNLVRRSWSSEDAVAQLAEADKQVVRDNLLNSFIRAPHIVQVQLGEVFKSIVYADYPEKLPNLLTSLATHLLSQDELYVHGGLYALRILVRKYEFRDLDDGPALNTIVDAMFPLLLQILQRLLAAPQTVNSQVPTFLKLVYKTFWSATFMGIPNYLVKRDAFVGWMSAFHTALVTPIPQEVQPADPYERATSSWWTARKWLLHITHRIFNRYSVVKHCKEVNDKPFASMYMSECMIQFLDAHVAQLAAVPGGAYMSPRCLNLIVQYLTHAVNVKPAYVHLKAAWDGMLHNAVFPLMAFTEEDAQLWEDDPQEYIRKGYDIMEDMYSPKSAAMNFAHELCTAKKAHLDRFMASLAAQLTAHQQAATAGPVDVATARRVDGVLLAIGCISDILKVKSPYKQQLGPMLLTYVMPCFKSPHGHIRAKACWLAGQYSDTEFSEGAGRGSGYSSLFEQVIFALSDPELPVRVDAVVAVRQFVEELEDVDMLRPLLPQLLNSIFTVMEQVDNEDLVETLGSLVERFGDDIAPYAQQMCVQLAATFWRYAGNADDEDDDTSGIAAFTCIRTINTVLDSVSTMPALYASLEDTLFPIMQKMISTDGQDIFEEVLEMLGLFTFYSPSISDRLWSLWPQLHASLEEFGIDYWEHLLIPLDNYIGRDTQRFLTTTTPDYQASAFRMVQMSLTGDHQDSEVVPAARLVEIIFQNCRGRIDAYLSPYLEVVLGRLKAGVEERQLQDALMICVANALYYNAPLTLAALHHLGATATFFTALFSMIFTTRKVVTASGVAPGNKPRHFRRIGDKKVLVLALSSLLACPDASLPAELVAGMPQVISGILKELIYLKDQQEEYAKLAAEGSDDEDEEAEEEDDEDEDGWESEDYEKAVAAKEDKDDAYLKGLEKIGREMVSGSGDKDDSDDEFNMDEDDTVTTPLDPIDAFVFFADALGGLQQSMPARYQSLMASVDPSAQPAIMGMLQFAEQQRAEQLQKASLPS